MFAEFNFEIRCFCLNRVYDLFDLAADTATSVLEYCID